MAFEIFAIVELFGHSRITGKVTEQVIGGASFIRVDVPKTTRREAFTKYYGSAAIYSMTPVDEATAQIAAESYEVEAVETWRFKMPESHKQLSQAVADERDDDLDDEEFDDAWDVQF